MKVKNINVANLEIMDKEKVKYWLELQMAKNDNAIEGWNLRSMSTNICDNDGRNPIDNLQEDNRIIQYLFDLNNK